MGWRPERKQTAYACVCLVTKARDASVPCAANTHCSDRGLGVTRGGIFAAFYSAEYAQTKRPCVMCFGEVKEASSSTTVCRRELALHATDRVHREISGFKLQVYCTRHNQRPRDWWLRAIERGSHQAKQAKCVCGLRFPVRSRTCPGRTTPPLVE